MRYRFAVSHCGLEHLVDFDGSFWEPIPPLVEGIDRPSSLKNGELGTITMINPSEATYASSSGETVALQRVGDSVVRGGCI